MLARLEQAVGVLLVLLTLADVFLTVLYARVGTGLLSRRLACWAWYVFRAAARPMQRHREVLLSFCGPAILVALVSMWVLALAVGMALVIHPTLGTSFHASSGPMPTDFFTALSITGDSITTVGSSDLAPATPAARLLYTFNSVVGISVITLTLTYFLQVYNALQRRNTFALKLHLGTGETGDAAELIAGVGAQGKFDGGYSQLAEIAAELAGIKEAHHFYPVVFYFRFREPSYALSRVAVVSLDTVSLIKSGLDDRQYAWLKESAAMGQLWRGAMHLMTLLAWAFLPERLPEPEPLDEAQVECWRRRYHAALRRLRQAGIETIADEAAGAESYIALRARWDRYISAFAHHMAHSMLEVDPASANPEAADERQEFEVRLRSAG